MKYLFLITAIVLVSASVATYMSLPSVNSAIPVFYWVTDANPARKEQINLFHRWLIRNDHVRKFEVKTLSEARSVRSKLADTVWDDIVATQPETAPLFDPEGLDADALEPKLPMTVRAPGAELRTDSANRQQAKQIIQGVSLVAGDVLDMGGASLPLFYQIGMLEEQTEPAQRLGYGPDKTYSAIVPDLMVDDQQYLFPCNVAVALYWINKDTFHRYGIELPSTRWTIEEFERIGKAFVEAANPEDQRRSVFFTPDVSIPDLYHSMGMDVFNETLTGTTLDEENRPEDFEKFIRAHELIYKWTYEDRILPTAADAQSFDTEAGYGGAKLQLFNRGNYGMVRIGRFALIQLRRFGSMNLEVVEPPHAGFPVAAITTRAAAVYKASSNIEYANLFQAYRASEDYNMQIVHDGDALPPNPIYTKTEEFLRPPEYPNEWGIHGKFAKAAETIAVANATSPYVLPSRSARILGNAKEDYMNGRKTMRQATREAAEGIDNAIQRTLREAPKLREEYDKQVELQKKIDARRANGQKVPLSWIRNPFYRKYYQQMGWVSTSGEDAEAGQ